MNATNKRRDVFIVLELNVMNQTPVAANNFALGNYLQVRTNKPYKIFTSILKEGFMLGSRNAPLNTCTHTDTRTRSPINAAFCEKRYFATLLKLYVSKIFTVCLFLLHPLFLALARSYIHRHARMLALSPSRSPAL